MAHTQSNTDHPARSDSHGKAAPYDRLIDQEMWAFIDATNAYYPEDAVSLSVAEQRTLYNTMCLGFHAGRPTGIKTRDHTTGAPPVPVREYRSTNSNANDEACVIYYHGGGFVVGDLESHDDVCAEICAATGFTVISADYRLAPEHTHPASFDDACSVFEAVAQTCTGRVVLAGDSAGAGLAAAVSAKARDSAHRPAGQVLMYPYLGGPLDSGSAVVHADAPMLKTRDLDFYHQARVPLGQVAPHHESFAPLWGKSYLALPPTIALSAECDPVCDDGRLYAEAINDAGGCARWVVEPGMVHGYLRARHMSTGAAAAFSRVLAAIEMLGRDSWQS